MDDPDCAFQLIGCDCIDLWEQATQLVLVLWRELLEGRFVKEGPETIRFKLLLSIDMLHGWDR